jgi:uncharacterized membrane protein HdeD (DUF308 family)
MTAHAPPSTPYEHGASVGRYWWLALAAGVLSIVVGVIALAYPGPTLLAVCIIVGVYLIIWGVMTTIRGVAGERGLTTLARVVLALLGLLTVLAGLIVLVRPGESVVAIAWVVGFWWVLTGVMEVIAGIVEPDGRGWNLALGALGIVAGAVILAWPEIGLVTLVWIVGLGLILRGVAEIVAGLAIRRLHKQGAV